MITLNPNSMRSNALSEPNAGNALTQPNADPAGFASLLRQSQVAAPPPPLAAPPAPPAPPAPTPAPAPEGQNDPAPQANANQAPEKNEAPQAPEPVDRSRGKAKAGTKSAEAGDKSPTEGPRGTEATEGQAAKAVAPEAGKAAKANGASTTPAAIDPTMMQLLAGLQRGAAPVAKADSGTPLADGGQAQLPVDARGKAADLQALDAVQEKSALGLEPVADGGSFAAALVAQQSEEKPRAAPGSEGDRLKDASAVGASASSAFSLTATQAAAAPASVAVATPVTAPDFAQELGLHLSVLAKDGVQQAELHLNPADMGPVSVQIVMDGTQAHVAFGADQAATRQAIEAGLPQLAGALADAGFTLAGGGVSQHAGGRNSGEGSRQGDPSRRAQPVSAEATSRVGTAARKIVRQGGVDLFA